MSLRGQIRRYLGWMIAIIVLMALGLTAAYIILREQGFKFPWETVYSFEAEFQTAQALSPGQGHTVTIAGVEVGFVTGVRLEEGKAIVEMEIEERFAPIYRDAQMLMRQRTPLKDMQVQLDPGTEDAGEVPDGGRIPLAQTQPDVNLEEVLSSLDTDTRHHFRLLLAAGAEGLGDQSENLRRVLRASQPTARSLAEVTDAIADRRAKVRRLVTNLSRISEVTAGRDDEIAAVVGQAATTLDAIATQESGLRESLERTPGTLTAAERALEDGAELSRALGPAAAALRPVARELPGASRELRPLAREATPILRDQIRPLVRDAIPVVRRLAPAARDLRATAPTLLPTADAVNHIVNGLLHDPPNDNPYLFYLAWFAHNGASMLSTEDAHGSQWRGQVILSCSSLEMLQNEVPALAALWSLPVCPDLPTP